MVKIGRKTLGRTLTLSSELVPFQEIDVYAKESGYVKELQRGLRNAREGGPVLATLEIPELQSQLKQDDAAIKNASDQITHAENELSRVEAQHKVLQLQFDRLNGVAKSKPGLVAQQEVDDAQGKALASAAQVEAAKSNLQSAQSQLAAAQAKREHDQVLFDYAKITAPFAGVVTQRYANLGHAGAGRHQFQHPGDAAGAALGGRSIPPGDSGAGILCPLSSTSAIRSSVRVPSLNRTFPGKVARFSVDVREDTRTMHTEVDVPNPQRVLMPGLYAEATITLERKDRRAGGAAAGGGSQRRSDDGGRGRSHPTRSKSVQSCSAFRPPRMRRCSPA